MSPSQTELIQRKLSKRLESQTYDDKKLRQDKKHIDKKTKAGYKGKEVDKKAKEREGDYDQEGVQVHHLPPIHQVGLVKGYEVPPLVGMWDGLSLI